MIQDAINAISSIQKKYVNFYSLEIFEDGSMIIHYMKDIETDEVFQEDFNNAQELLEWVEENLIVKQ